MSPLKSILAVVLALFTFTSCESYDPALYVEPGTSRKVLLVNDLPSTGRSMIGVLTSSYENFDASPYRDYIMAQVRAKLPSNFEVVGEVQERLPANPGSRQALFSRLKSQSGADYLLIVKTEQGVIYAATQYSPTVRQSGFYFARPMLVGRPQIAACFSLRLANETGPNYQELIALSTKWQRKVTIPGKIENVSELSAEGKRAFDAEMRALIDDLVDESVQKLAKGRLHPEWQTYLVGTEYYSR